MSSPQANILATILGGIESFSSSERRIAEFVLENQDAIILNQADLAVATETSASTVSRFCRRVGMKNYREFQTVLYGELLTMHGEKNLATQEVSLDNVLGSLKLIMDTKTSDMESLIDSSAAETIEQIARALLASNRIFVAGIGKTIPCAIDASYKFSLVGLHAETSEIYEKQLSSALTLSEGDMVYFISASGYCPRLQRVAAAAHDRGAMTVVVTGNSSSPMAKQADILLATVSSERVLNSTFGYSITPYIMVNEILYLLLASSAGASESLEVNLRYQIGKGLTRGD